MAKHTTPVFNERHANQKTLEKVCKEGATMLSRDIVAQKTTGRDT